MSKKAVLPDAWDDDWESQADKLDAALEQPPQQEVKLTKSERLAQHARANDELWSSAENPETFHFLAAKDNLPLKTEFKPALKLLSRKPAPKYVETFDPATGLSKMVLVDDDADDELKNKQPSPEELRLKALREREEKQKKYDEARARIMGTGSSTPAATAGTENGKGNRGRGRGRGTDSRQTNSQSGPSKELFDPSYTPKPGFTLQKAQNRNGESSSGRSTPRPEEQIVREPRGPDGTGRGGFGFASRGGKS